MSIPAIGQKNTKPRWLTKVKAWDGDESLLLGGRLKVSLRCDSSFFKSMSDMRRLYPAGIHNERYNPALCMSYLYFSMALAWVQIIQISIRLRAQRCQT